MDTKNIVCKNYTEVALPSPTSIAIGCFDGVHVAHQEIIKNAILKAKNSRISSAVVMFSPHPKQFFSPNKYKAINTLEENARMIKGLGAKHIIVLNFNQELANLSAENFALYLANTLNAKHITTGCNFRFGRNRQGDGDFLKRMAHKYSFKYQAIKRITVEHEEASSSNIKRLVEARCLQRAANLLGRPFSINCTVRTNAIEQHKEDKYLKLQLDSNFNNIIMPQNGVYYTMLEAEDKGKLTNKYQCVSMVEPSSINTYFCNFNLEEIVIRKDAQYRLHFIDLMRPIRNFTNKEEYFYQLDLDKKAMLYLVHAGI